jgi:hypothetical protein
MTRLLRSIDRLISFFENVTMPGMNDHVWALALKDIREEIALPSTRTQGLNKLEACFGGMGSLNDYVFHTNNHNIPPNDDGDALQRKLDSLLDECFRELRLLNTSWWTRYYWYFMELRNRHALPPRIANTFQPR